VYREKIYLRRAYLKEVLLRIGGVELGMIDLAEEGDQVLDALIVLLVGYTVCRREFKQEGRYFRHCAVASRERSIQVKILGGGECCSSRGNRGELRPSKLVVFY
jgi:hypothetical protein